MKTFLFQFHPQLHVLKAQMVNYWVAPGQLLDHLHKTYPTIIRIKFGGSQRSQLIQMRNGVQKIGTIREPTYRD